MSILKLSSEAPDSRGIKSFRDWRFWLVVVLLSASFYCMLNEPYFKNCGEFVFRQGVIVLFLALTIAAAFLWETPIFGKPAGANLLLQSFSIAPFALLVTRLCASDGKSSAELALPKFTGFWHWMESLSVSALSYIPAWIREIFANWQITLLFLLVLGVLCLRRIQLRAGAIGVILLLLFAVQLNRGTDLKFFLFATLFFIAALSFMFSRYDRISYYENILKRLHRSQTLGAEELRAVLLVMEQLERKKRLSDGNFRQIVKDCYTADRPYNETELNLISGEVAKRMIHNHNLVSLRNDGEGIFLFPDPLLFYDDNLLRSVATIPRIVFVGLFALLWVLMPVDLIPDALPLVGTLDDIAVMILSGVVIQNSARPTYERNE